MYLFLKYKCFLGLFAGMMMSVARASSSLAGPDVIDSKTVVPTEDMLVAFHRGVLDFQVALGAEISLQNTSLLRPNIDYGLLVIRLGYMLDPVGGTNWLRGNDEVMIEAIGGPIYHGPGSALGGLSLLYRRNFVPGNGRIVPYLDFGAGGIYTDAYHQRPQRVLGAPFEFDLQVGTGLRYRFDAHWSMDGEVSYRHLSNADFASRNYGTNALGGLLGFSFAF